MKKQRVLISGDSFAADSSHIIDNSSSWTQLLKKYYDVTNIAEAGVGEYKILKQLQSTKLENFDHVIVVHTSPNRVHINHHPLHSNSKLHKNCDLIYNDILNSTIQNVVTTTALNYFKYIFDESYYYDIHKLLVKEILEITKSSQALHITFFDNLNNEVGDWSEIWNKNPGSINHLDVSGNELVLEKILTWINNHY